jgi:DNA-binding response OmpR family regulator
VRILAATGARGGARGGIRGRVLVVDDEPSICLALELALRRAGFAVVAAHSGEAAEARLRAEAFDAMVVDLRIPDVRGDVLFHQAVALQPHLKTQTLFFTGDVTARAQRIIEACGCPMVRKPFDLGDVIDALCALMPGSVVESA